jgi:hypothetical protein
MNWNTLLEPRVLAETINSLVSAIAILFGGIWVLYRFGLHREAHPRIEFDLELRYLGSHKSGTHVEVAAVLTNRGQVRHWINQYSLDLRVLKSGDPVVAGGPDLLCQTEFPHQLLDNQSLVSRSMDATFVDPGITQHYTFVTSVPADTVLVLVSARFSYRDSQSEFHTAQRAWNLEGIAATRTNTELELVGLRQSL